MNENIDSIVESRCTFTTVDQNPCSRCSQQVACCCNSLLLTTLTNLLASIVIIVPITSAYLFWTDYQKARKNLKLRREEYILAREERKQLECQLQDIEFREGNFPPKENQENASTAEGYTPALQRKHILCVIKKLYKRVERNNCEIKNLKEQKVQLVEDLGEARRVLCEAMNNFEKVCKMKNIEPTTSSSNETSKQYFDCEDYNSQDYIWNNNNTAY
uniref:Uncharacterized protein n=1 Tax=Rhodnius prolixus TaxID=13249 RepID=T1HUP1_RHOPR